MKSLTQKLILSGQITALAIAAVTMVGCSDSPNYSTPNVITHEDIWRGHEQQQRMLDYQQKVLNRPWPGSF